jgi:hypothetical protein
MVAPNSTLVPVRLIVACESCKRPVELECEGIAGVAGYETFQEYFCPYCRKVNRPRTPGHIIAARAARPA